MFDYKTQIFLHHTDAAGRLFFAHQFILVHDAKEKFLESLGLPVNQLIEDLKVSFPLIHAEADYKAVLKAGDRITIRTGIEKIGETSVVFAFSIHKADGTAKTVSVCVDKKTNAKTPIPQEWRLKLEQTISR